MGQPVKFDISSALVLDGDITIKRTVELEDVFVYGVSSMDLSFMVRLFPDDAFNYFKPEYLFNPDVLIGIMFKEKGINKFWGYLDKESLSEQLDRAKINSEGYAEYYRKSTSTSILTLTVIDWMKYIYDEMNDIPLIILSSITSATLLNILSENFGCDIVTGFEFAIGDIGTNLNKNQYQGLAATGLKKAELLTEIQKHYGAYCFVDKDKKLKLVNRNYYLNSNPQNVGHLIAGDGNRITKNKVSEHNSILISAWGNWGVGTVQHWVLMWQKNGDIKYIFVREDMSNIPRAAKYLDLRQKLKIDYQNLDWSTVSVVSATAGSVICNFTAGTSFLIDNEDIFGTVIRTGYSTAIHKYGCILGANILNSTQCQFIVNGWYPNTPANGEPVIFFKATNRSLMPGFATAMFPVRNAEDRWKDFENVLFPYTEMELTLNSANLGLFSKIKPDPLNEFILLEAEENLTQRTTDVKIITTDLQEIPDIDFEVDHLALSDSNNELIVTLDGYLLYPKIEIPESEQWQT